MATLPLPDSATTIVNQDGKPTKDFFNYLRSLTDFINKKTVSLTPRDLGTISSGSLTPNPSDGLKQKVTNGGAFTIAATSQIGDVQLMITNNASAGAITLSGFEKQWTGDSFDTTNGHKFILFIYGFDGRQSCLVRAMQ